jgi:hypothetical protein
MAVALTERPLRLEQIRLYQSFDHDLRICRNGKVDCNGFRGSQRHSRESPRHGHLVNINGKLHSPREHRHRSTAENDGTRHRLGTFFVLAPMQISAGTADTRGHTHPEPIRRLERGTIGAHVLNARVGIARDAERGGEIGRGVESRR